MLRSFGGKYWPYDMSCTLRSIKVNPGKKVPPAWDSSKDKRPEVTSLSMLYNTDNC